MIIEVAGDPGFRRATGLKPSRHELPWAVRPEQWQYAAVGSAAAALACVSLGGAAFSVMVLVEAIDSPLGDLPFYLGEALMLAAAVGFVALALVAAANALDAVLEFAYPRPLFVVEPGGFWDCAHDNFIAWSAIAHADFRDGWVKFELRGAQELRPSGPLLPTFVSRSRARRARKECFIHLPALVEDHFAFRQVLILMIKSEGGRVDEIPQARIVSR